MLSSTPASPKAFENDEIAVPRYTIPNSSSTSHVYLRIKPNPEENSEEIYTVLNSTTLLVRKSENIDRKFTFTRIFDSGVSQADFFYHSARHLVIDFLRGENLNILAYGASNSGKTHTMYGTPESPGLVPRAIDVLFSEVTCTLAPWYKITDDGKVIALNEQERACETRIKEDTINPKVTGKNEYAQARLSLDNSGSRASESGGPEFCSVDCMSSVWISIVEIYNENVYDLLVVGGQEKRPLKVTTLKDGSTRVNGSKFVHITTAFEACQLLVSVQSRMTVNSAAANPDSSLSHTFFTVKLLKYEKENVPDEVRVGTLTFCDMAGSRRSKKTEEALVRQTESRSINNSLLVLGRCLRKARDSHSIGDHLPGSFRESKLTRILRKVLAGREKVCFIVNIDTAADAFPETLSVLTVSAMARKLGVDAKTLKRNVFSVTTPRSLRSTASEKVLADDLEELEASRRRNRKLLERLEAVKIAGRKGRSVETKVSTATQSEYAFFDYEKLKEENERLARNLETLERERFDRESEVRQELADQYSAVIVALENSWKKRVQDIEDEDRDLLKWSVNQVESFYKERIDSIAGRKKRKRNDGESDDGIRTVCEDLERENAMVTSKVVVLRDVLRSLRAQNEILGTERNKCKFESVLIMEQLQNFHDRIRAAFPELFSRMQENAGGSDWLVHELKRMFDEKTRYSEDLENDLRNAREDYFKIASKSMEMEKRLYDTRIELREALTKLKDCESDAQEKKDSIQNPKPELYLLRKEPRESRINYDDSKYIGKEDVHSLIRKNDSACSDDFFFNDAADNTESIPRAKEYSNCTGVDIDRHTFLSSESGNVKEDSGIDCSCRSQRSSGINYGSVIQDKSTQTEFEEPPIDYVDSIRHHEERTPYDKELSEQVNDMNSVINTLQKIVDLNKAEVAVCRGKLATCETKLEELETENDNVTRMREMDSQRYDQRIGELTRELLVKEEEGNLNSKRLKNSLEKCGYIEDRLSVLRRVHEQIEGCFAKCKTEHICEIEKSEREPSTKSLGTNETNDGTAAQRTDLFRLQQLHGKVNRLETVLENCQERNDHRGRSQERFEERSMLETKLKWLSTEIRRRDDELESLKKEINDVLLTSDANDENLKSLVRQVVRSNENLRCAKEKLACFEETGNRLRESLTEAEAKSEESRLNNSVENTPRAKDESEGEEFGRSKSQLPENEQEMGSIKKHRRDLITKYECMVRQLRIEIEKKKERLAKLQKLIFSNLSRRCRKCSCNVGGKFTDFQTQTSTKHTDRSTNISRVDKKEGSEESANARYAPSLDSESSNKNEDSDSSSACKTEKPCATESSSGLNDSNVDERQIQSDASDCSEVPCGCGIGFKNASRQGRMSGWMKVRRSDARTDLLRRLDGE